MLQLNAGYMAKFRAEIRALIFDFDGVAVNSSQLTSSTFLTLLDAAFAHHVPVPVDILWRIKSSYPFIDLFQSVQKIFQINDEVLAADVVAEWMRLDQENPAPLFDKTHDSLEFLTGLIDGSSAVLSPWYVMGILTARSRGRLESALMYYDLKKYFHPELIISSDDYEGGKDSGHAFDDILERCAVRGIRPEQCLYCGDTPPDAVGALQQGIQFVGARSGMFSDEDFQRVGVPTENIIDGIWQLPAWLGI